MSEKVKVIQRNLNAYLPCDSTDRELLRVAKELLKMVKELQAKPDQWNKHDTAEEPSELYFNEVYGIGSMRDQYKIAELQEQVERVRGKADSWEHSLVSELNYDYWNAIRWCQESIKQALEQKL